MVLLADHSGTSDARLYWESVNNSFTNDPIDLPAACSIFPAEIRRRPRHWADRIFSNIIR